MSGAAYAIDARINYVNADGSLIGGAIGVLNPVKLNITTPEANKVQRISRLRDSYGQALEELVTPKPTEIELSTDDLGDANTLAWALNGEAVGFAQSSATVTAEVHTANLGTWLRLANRAVSAVVVKDAATGLVTYVLNTDYLLDPVSGQVKPLVGGSIVDAAGLTFAYTAAVLAGKLVKVGTRPNIYVRIDGEGKNLVDGSPVHVLVRRASLSSAGALDLVGGQFLVADLKGTALIVGSNPAAEITQIAA